jgi:tetratricopeptide (TPR) repeat protein
LWAVARQLLQQEVTVADKYNEINPEDRKKADAFFQRARTVGGTGNFDFAIEMFTQGLMLDPENVDAHIDLRDISMKRKASGGKAMGFFDARKHSTNNRDDKLNMVNAEKLLGYDPGNTDYMQALLQNAHKAGYFDTVMWIGPIFQKANADSKKPEFSKFVVLKDVYKSLAMDTATPPRIRAELLKRATNACHFAAKMKPDEMDLQTELKNLGALHTQVEGNYDSGGSFQDSIKDKDEQEKLQAQDKGVQEIGVMGKLINDAEAQYRANPEEPGKMLRLVEMLEKTEHPEYEGRAIDLLTEWFDRTKQFRFRKRIGEINMRQWRRMEQSQKEMVAKNPTDEQLKKDFHQFQDDKNEFELSEFNLWAENYPTDMTFKFRAAERMFALKRYEESIPLLQNAEADAKYRIRARLLQGQAFYQLKFYDEAVDTLDSLIRDYQMKGDDVSKEMHYWSGRAHEDRGDAEVAIKLYSAIVRMEFNYRDAQGRIKKLRAGLGGNAAT